MAENISVAAPIIGSRIRPRLSLDLWLYAAYVLSMPVYCLVRLTGNDSLTWIATAFTSLAWFSCVLVNARGRLGSSRTAQMLASGFAIALLFEYLGSRHGILFGNYHYTDLLGPKVLGAVPVIIPIAWFMMLYPSWRIASRLASRVKPTLFNSARIVIGALAMTAWDLSLDPRWVADGGWVWHDGGIYFGIPLSNFLGWLLTSMLIFGVWSRIDREPQHKAAQQTLPEWVYITTWMGESVANVLFWGGPLLGLIVFLAMGVFAAPVLREITHGFRQRLARLT